MLVSLLNMLGDSRRICWFTLLTCTYILICITYMHIHSYRLKSTTNFIYGICKYIIYYNIQNKTDNFGKENYRK